MEVRGTTLEGPNLIFYPIVHEYREGKVKRPLGCEKNMKPHAFPPRMHKHIVFVTLYLLHNGPVTSSSEQAKLRGVRRSESESAPILVEVNSKGVEFAGGDPKPSDLSMSKLKFAGHGHGGLNPRL